eukprot:1142795-Pelagomonas_calceolata.AAC.2
MHADIPGFIKSERLPFDKQQISEYPTNSQIDNQEGVCAPEQSSPTQILEVPDWRTRACTDGIFHVKNGKREIGIGVYCPLTDRKKNIPTVMELPTTYVELNEQQLLLSSRTVMHIASDSLTSLHQIRKQFIYPEKHKQHI